MKGGAPLTKVHYKGQEDDFVIYVESVQAVKDWKGDKSVPLAQVVSGWKVFTTHKQGAQGILDGASNQQLDSEFGTHKEEDVVTQILEKGNVQETSSDARQGQTNVANGPGVGSGNLH